MSDSAKSGNPTKRSKPSINWRKTLTYVTLICVVGYGLSIALLNSSWFKSKLTNKLHEKISSDWKVGRISWVPFGDITVNDLHTSLGEGGVTLTSLKATPLWSSLLSGELELNELVIDEGLIDLDLKWLKENRINSRNINHPSSQPNTQHSSSEPTIKEEPIAEATPQPKTSPESNKATRKTSPPSPNSKTSSPATPQPLELVDSPNKWLKLKNLTLVIRNGKEVIDEITDVNLDIPISGKPTKGEASYTFQGSEIHQSVIWDGRLLRAENLTGEQFGIKYQWRALCNVKQRNLPFSFQFNIHQQPLKAQINQPNLHWGLKAKSVESQIQCNGGLASPQTWRGLIRIGATDLIISENQKTHKRAEFDHLRLIGNVNRGKLHIPIAEAIGYDTSILANGVIQNDLYSYGVLRIITHAQSSEFFNRVHRGSKVIHIDKGSRHFFERLDTPDRQYCDIYLDGKLTELEMKHNRSDRWQTLVPTLKKLIRFKDNELLEDGILEDSDEY